MSNSSKVTIFAVGVVGVLAMYGLGCKAKPQVDPTLLSTENAVNEKVEHDPRLKNVDPALNIAEYAINKESLSNPAVKKSGEALFGVLGGITSTVSSPLKVHGGSVQAEAMLCWSPLGKDPATSSYMTFAVQDPLFLYIDNVTDAAPKPLRLNNNWTVTLTFNDGGGPEYHSIIFKGTSEFSGGVHEISMQGDADGQWMNSGYCASTAKAYSSLNYQVQHCGGSPGHYGPGSEPACNHLSQISIAPGSLADPSQPTTYTCLPIGQQAQKPCTIEIAPEN